MKLSSTNKRVLLVSDIHHRSSRLQSIIKHESPDYIVCLGDWFDSHIYDSNFDCEKTAKYLLKYIHQDNTFTLWGNHDLHYFYTNPHLVCSGYSPYKDELITESLHPVFNNVKDKFKWYIWIDDILCTHAGLHPNFISPTVKTINDIETFLVDEENKIRTKIITGESYWAYCAGRARGGFFKYGGITWLDFNDEFAPIDDLRQIVGHTHSHNGKIYSHHTEGVMDVTEANNICIDCDLNEYLIIHNQKLEIKKFADL